MEKSKVEDLALLAKDGKIEIIHRTGEAEKFLDPVEPLEKIQLNLSGNIDTPFNFLKKRWHLLNCDDCNIMVDREGYLIRFIANEQQVGNNHPINITGKIKKTANIVNFPFGKSYRPIELARELRMRSHLFESSDVFKQLFQELSSFKAKVDKEVEKADDRSGNATSLIRQKVVHNLSNIFRLKMEVLKGADPIIFEVEIDIDPETLDCTMIAPELEPKMQQLADEMIENELNKEVTDKVILRDWCLVYYC